MENEQECAMDDHIDNEENVENINDTNVQNEEVRQETKNVDQEVNVVTTDAENPPEKIDATTTDTNLDSNGTNGIEDNNSFPECPPEFYPNDNNPEFYHHMDSEERNYQPEIPQACDSIETPYEHSFNDTHVELPLELGTGHDGENLPIEVQDDFPPAIPKEYLTEHQDDLTSTEAHDRDSIEAQVDYPIGTLDDPSNEPNEGYDHHEEFPIETLIDFTPVESKDECFIKNHQSQQECSENTIPEEFPQELLNSAITMKAECPNEPDVEFSNSTEVPDLPPEPPAPLLEYYPTHVEQGSETRDECKLSLQNGNPKVELEPIEAPENSQIREMNEGNVPTEFNQEQVCALPQNHNGSELSLENKPVDMNQESTVRESNVPTENTPVNVPLNCDPSPEGLHQIIASSERQQDTQNEAPSNEQLEINEMHIVTFKTEGTNHKNHDTKAMDDVIIVDPLPGKENGKALNDSTEPTRNESFGNRVLHCLSQVPCASLIAWIILLVGLGGLTGGLLIGIQKTRDLVEIDNLFWFLEYAVAGVVAGMFVFGTVLLCVGHISTDPTSRHIFHTTKRNLCAQGLNITMLIFSYIFGILWVLLTAIFGVPLYLLVNILIIHDDVNEINLVNYGLNDKTYKGEDLTNFLVEVNRLLVIYITIFVSSLLITISMVHFLIVISSNLTHLKDTRLATLNAYSDHTDMQNSKHSVVDTTM